jgi:hypothetical protein
LKASGASSRLPRTTIAVSTARAAQKTHALRTGVASGDGSSYVADA